MAKKPTDPHDQPHDPAVPPPEPADVYDDVLAEDVTEISEADLFDLGEDETPPTPDSPALPGDPHAWDSLEAEVKLPASSDSSVLAGQNTEVSGGGSGWLESGVNLGQAARPDVPAGRHPSTSGVNLHDPDGLEEPDTGSSIFGRGATDQSSRIDLPILPDAPDADAVAASIWDDQDITPTVPAENEDPAGTVDWDAMKGLGAQMRGLRHDPADSGSDEDQLSLAMPRPEHEGEPAEDVDWDALKGLGAQMRGVRQNPDDLELDAGAGDDDVRSTLTNPDPDDLGDWLDEEVKTAAKPASKPQLDSTAVGMPVGTTSPRRAAAAPILAESDDDFDDIADDEPITPKKPTKEKKKSRAAAWVGGGALGLLLGGGGVFGLSQAGILPGAEESPKPLAGTGLATAPPADAGKLDQLQKSLQKAEADRAGVADQLTAAQKLADKADADRLAAITQQADAEMKLKAVIDQRDKAALELNAAKNDLQTAMADLTAAKNGLTALNKDVDEAQAKAKASEDVLAGMVKEFKAAKLIPADADPVDARAKLPDAAKKATAAAMSGDAAKAAEALAAAKKELDASQASLKTITDDLAKAKADTDAAMKVADARAKALTEAEAKAKTTNDSVADLVKAFKAAKLIPADADDATAIAKLPDVVKQVGAMTLSGDAEKAAKLLADAKKEIDTAQAALKATETELEKTRADAKAATADLAKAKADADKAMKTAEERAKELADAEKKAKAADDALAGLVKEFKAAKLIPADADPADALAKLPDAAKKATAAAMSGDAAKTAEALAAAKKELETAQAAAKKAETDLAAAEKAAKDAMTLADKAAETAKADAAKLVEAAKADAAKAMKEADDKAKLAIDKATAEARSELLKAQTEAKAVDAQLKAALSKAGADAQEAAKATAAAKAAAEQLAVKEAEFARQLAAAKASAALAGPQVSPDVIAQEKATAAYSAGVSAYFAGRYEVAAQELKTAADAGADARYNYFLGLSQLALGQTDAAAKNFTAGAALERRNRPNVRDIGDALMRIQGPARVELSKYRP